MRFTAYLFISILWLGQIAFGQAVTFKTDNPLKSHIDSIVQQAAADYLQAPHTYDLAIGVYSYGKKYEYSFHQGAGKLPTGNTYYGIGSIAKVFAGWMLANAVIERKLNLNDDIRKYLPGKYPNLQYNGHPVRIVDLSNHTSAMPGLSKDYSDKFMDSISKLKPEALTRFFEVYTADSLFKDMHHFKLDTIPGTRFRYNGNAVMVLIAILQRVYHRPYPELITTYLQEQYGMNHTRPRLSKIQENEILQGHDETGKEVPLVIDKGFRAAPTMLSTPDDMLKFVQANLNAKEPVIRLSHQQTFTTPDGMRLGLNWMMDKDDNGLPFIMHTGRDSFGFTALCYIYPGKQTGIIIMVNDSNGEDKVSALKDHIITHLLTK